MDSTTTVAEGYTNPDSSTIEFMVVRAGDYHVVVTGDGIETTDSGRFKVIGLGVARTLDVAVRRTGETNSKSPKAGAAILLIPSGAMKQFNKGSELMAKKEWQKAIPPLKNAVSQYPKFAAAYNSLGTAYIQLGDKSAARDALNKAVSADDHFAPAYISLAKMAIDERNFPEAEEMLKKAVVADPTSPQVWIVLANVQLLNQHYPEAIASCQKVYSISKGPYPAAHHIAALAYEHENQSAKAVAELETLLKEEPTGPLADEARKEMVTARQAGASADPPHAPAAIEAALPEARNWAPPDIDRSIPEAHSEPPCSISDVLHKVGDKALELVTNLQQFSATEHIVHAELDRNGDLLSTNNGTFTYVAEIREVPPNRLTVNEYRNSSLAIDSFPTRLVTRGTAAFALIFHADYADDFSMTCEGLTEVQGQPAWQVHFAQRPDKPSRFRNYYIRQHWYPVNLKGRAWIAADSYQVVRLETDLIEPIKEIELQREHLVIEYRAIDFPKRKIQLWLPESSDIYLDFRGHRYHDRHSFKDFELFWVETNQKDATQKLETKQ